MKISKIYLKDFHQFKDLLIDLTYPKGHEMAGQPLQKICFIGQSGTGKTSLLELIPKFVTKYNTVLIDKSGGTDSIVKKIFMALVFGEENEYYSVLEYTKQTENDKATFMRSWSKTKYKNESIDWKSAVDFYTEKWLKEIASKPIYFPSNLDYSIEIETENGLMDKPIIDFSQEKVAVVWNVILEQIKLYQEQEIKIRLEVSNELEHLSDDLEAIENAFIKLKEWKKTQFNPVQDVADNCLDSLLAPFKLKVKTKLDFKSKEDIGFIKVEDFSANEIPNGLWSTGTKQVILSALPLYLLKPKHTVILFDEPERSLYPDIQRLIVDYYSSLTENCQFFYATHSPIIASNFDPWEIVELKFNDKGKIYRELYYDGDNHIDNYKWNPQYMRWDDILQRIFDIGYDGSLVRKEKLDELAKNNVKLRKLENQGKAGSEEAEEILIQIQKLSKELSTWD